MIERLKEVLSIQSESLNQWRMFAYLVRHLTRNKIPFYVHGGNIYATKGVANTYPCVVAHMDTVHDIVSDLTILHVKSDLGDKLTGFNTHTMTQSGIGGDDKVGIFIALEALSKHEFIKLAFFRDEEIGCMGSRDADMQFFDDVGYVLQCDRRGNKDFILNASGTKLASKAFRKAVSGILKQYDYKIGDGMMTDVMQLKQNGLKVSSANIACGYYNPHSANEYVQVDDVYTALELVNDIIETFKDTAYPHTYERSYSYSNYKSDWYLDPATKKWHQRSPVKEESNWWDEPLDSGEYWWKEGYTSNTKSVSTYSSVAGVCDGCAQTKLVKYCSSLNGIMCDDCINYFA